jgi:serine/threonine-protein kinase
MPIETANELHESLRASRLFTPEQLAAVLGELAPLGDNLPAALKHLVRTNRLSFYQLRKVVHRRAAELFVGPYVITDKIGEGGMGRVYRARHARMGREVALKVARPNLLTNPVILARYLREVEAAGTLRHPNIVRVEDAGESGGRHYLAMEFVDGLDLGRLVQAHRPLEVEEACEYARQVALGLQHAHECGFVHRDIKPSNIVVAGERHVPQATEPALVKILDLGLIRPVGFEEGLGGCDLTRAGSVVGTPDYMAPEQAKDSHAVDHRADLYSLGCTLYFLLTSQPPFPDGTPLEKLLRHQVEAPPPVQALRPEIPSPVAAVVARLMAKNPDDRYPTAVWAAAALAPLAVYPHGAKPVPIRIWGLPPDPKAETLHYSSRSTPQPLSGTGGCRPPSSCSSSESGPGNHPAILAALPEALVATASVSSAPPSCPRIAPVAEQPAPPRRGWLAAGIALLVAGVAALVLAAG